MSWKHALQVIAAGSVVGLVVGIVGSLGLHLIDFSGDSGAVLTAASIGASVGVLPWLTRGWSRKGELG